MKNTNYTGGHEHEHSKGGLMGLAISLRRLKGLQETKWFGAKHGARHEAAQNKALRKKRGENTMPF
jgi:hypothetical protein